MGKNFKRLGVAFKHDYLGTGISRTYLIPHAEEGLYIFEIRRIVTEELKEKLSKVYSIAELRKLPNNLVYIKLIIGLFSGEHLITVGEAIKHLNQKL